MSCFYMGMKSPLAPTARADFTLSNAAMGRNNSVRGVKKADSYVTPVPDVGPDTCVFFNAIQHSGKTIKNGKGVPRPAFVPRAMVGSTRSLFF